MIKKDGLWLLEAAKKRHPYILFYLMSGIAKHFESEGIAKGAEAVFAKPIDVEHLSSEILKKLGTISPLVKIDLKASG